MLSELELNAYLDSHAVSGPARDYIIRVHGRQTAREVGRFASQNVCSIWPSAKMGMPIQAESRTGERAYIILREYDEDTLAYWDQPEPIPVRRVQKNGIRRRSYTPDYLVLHQDGPFVVEIKPLVVVNEKIRTNPEEWQENGDSNYVFVPANVAFANLGLMHKVVTDSELSSVEVQNKELLLNSRQYTDPSETVRSAILSYLTDNAWATIDELRAAAGLSNYDPLLRMIDTNQLHTPLADQSLEFPKRTIVAKTASLLNLGLQHEQISSTSLDCPPDESDLVPLSQVPTEKAALSALAKLNKLADEDAPRRSMERWRQRIREGSALGLTNFESLLPADHRKGNRSPRLNGKQLDAIFHVIATDCADTRNLTIANAYTQYRLYAKQSHPEFPPASRRTFTRYLNKSDQVELARGRGGRRLANSARAPSRISDREIPTNLPFRTAALDHYKCDVFCRIVGSDDSQQVLRPWLTALVDTSTSSLLAWVVRLSSPDRRACGAIVRQCVRQWSRLPQSIIVDRGRELQSAYFRGLLATYGVELMSRPAGNARFGGEVERFFGSFRTQYLQNQPGAITPINDRRSRSRSHDPENYADLSLEELIGGLEEYGKIYGSYVPENAKESRDTTVQNALIDYPSLGRRVELDKSFRVATSVESRNLTVDGRRGVRLNGSWYWAPILTSIPARHRVEARLDPEDPYLIYVNQNGAWHPCFAAAHRSFVFASNAEKKADALRVLEARATRERTNQEITDNGASQLESTRNRQKSEKTKTDKEICNEPSSHSSKHIFSQLRERDIDPLKSIDWNYDENSKGTK